MKNLSSILKRTLYCFFVTLFTLSLFYSNQTKAQCAGVVVTTPTLDVRGSTVLCVGSNLEICPSVWGYSNFQWYKDSVAYSTSSCITITIPGTYTLAGQDGSGCWSSQSTAVVVTSGISPAIPTISAGGATTFCGGGSVVLSSSSATANQWYKDSIAIGGATDSTYTATTSGVYQVAVVGCGSSLSTGTIVTVNAAPIVTDIIGGTSVCVGSSLTLSDTTIGGTWSSSDTLIATVSGGVVTTIAAGTTTISYSISSGGCTTTVTKTITVAAIATPTLDVRDATTLCGNSVEICPLVWGFSNYQWYKDGVAYSTSSCITVTTAGSYTLTGENSAGCWSSASTAAVITTGTPPATPTVSAGGTTTFCGGGSVVLTSSSATANQWYKDSIAIGGATSATYTATVSGVYKVAVVGCGSSLSTSIAVTVNATPTVAAITGNTTVCLGNALTLANATAGGTWSSSDTTKATVSGGVITAIAAGSSIISYTVSNGTCSTTVTRTITVFPVSVPPTINAAGSPNLCTGASVQLCPLVWGYSNYMWYKDGVAYSTAACITVSTAASYTLKGQNGAGCWSAPSAAVVTTVNPIPTVVASTGATAVCPTATITLANASTIPLGATATWSSLYGRSSVTSGGVVTGINPGADYIKYTITSSFGCSAATNYAITISTPPSMPSINYAPGTINPQAGPGGAFCNGRTFTLVGTPSGGVWTSSNTAAFTVTSGGGVTSTVGVGTGTLTYRYTAVNGCSNSRSITGTVANCAGGRGVSIDNGQLKMDNTFTIYPNPAKTFVRLNVATLVGAGSIVITDLYGKQVTTQTLSMGTNTIDVSRLSKGMYFVSMITSEGKTTKKLVVE